jgi:hypothetical protein
MARTRIDIIEVVGFAVVVLSGALAAFILFSVW